MTSPLSVFVHIVSYNSANYLAPCLQSVVSQQGFDFGRTLWLRVTDNCSSDKSVEVAREVAGSSASIVCNTANLGFCAGHNQGVQAFLQSACSFMLVLNPDVKLEPDALRRMAEALAADPKAGMASARLMRCDEALQPLQPPMFDSAGMFMTPSLRHFDRGSGELDRGQYRDPQYVFGATGACLLLKRECVSDLVVEDPAFDAVQRLYPQLAQDRSQRIQLFDEAFFAYREDADLAWRANLFGWRTLYVPEAVGYHKRVVVPERRRSLPAELNRLGVRNRFLLQMNNFTSSAGVITFLEGVLLRNLIVLAGVLFYERSSLAGLREVILLRRRALLRRRIVLQKSLERMNSAATIGRWFQRQPFAERVA